MAVWVAVIAAEHFLKTRTFFRSLCFLGLLVLGKAFDTQRRVVGESDYYYIIYVYR